MQLEFTGQVGGCAAVVGSLYRFNINNNIISAQMDYSGGVKFGVMLTEMEGDEADAAAIAYLQQHQANVEVLGY
ncbi:NIL domain-containing protein [Sodalis sp.]|uniref:NIL domain-containing protein n=1 Tax=Sodalis sp. (in: enterobacteria) TaxID=1898979 RepID=UPI003873820C